jgi:hypothetical protein
VQFSSGLFLSGLFIYFISVTSYRKYLDPEFIPEVNWPSRSCCFVISLNSKIFLYWPWVLSFRFHFRDSNRDIQLAIIIVPQFYIHKNISEM